MLYVESRKSFKARREKNLFICRVQKKTRGKIISLPSAKRKHSANKYTRQRNIFAECKYLALGKEICLPSVFVWQSAKKQVFFSSDLKTFFCSPHTTCGTPC